MIDFNDYSTEIARLSDGEQIHVNHKDCTAGSDTKRRLYLRRTSDGTTTLAYCHHCGEKGVLRKGRALKSVKALTEEVTKHVETGILIPKWDSTPLDNLHYAAHLGKFNLYMGLVSRSALPNFLQYNSEMNLVGMPFFSNLILTTAPTREGVQDAAIGYQMRTPSSVVGSSIRSKYITAWKEDRFKATYDYSLIEVHSSHGLNDEKLVTSIIVEDLVSQYITALMLLHLLRTHDSWRVKIWCNMGTQLKDIPKRVMLADRRQYGEVANPLIWLDNDIAGHKATGKMVIDLGNTYKSSVPLYDEPKYIHPADLGVGIMQMLTDKENHVRKSTSAIDGKQGSVQSN